MNLPNKKTFTKTIHGRELTFTISDAAGQANASVIGQYGDTSVLVTAVMGSQDRDIDFFPLTVDYEERFYAAGKVLGSRFMRREARPSDFAVLSGRLIDRTIRPLFNSKLRREVQVVITILSYDGQNDPDFLALVTTSLALSLSDIPWDGPVAGLRVLKTNGEVIFNPTNEQAENVVEREELMDGFFAGTADRVNMLEVAANESQEVDMKDIFEKSFKEIKELVAFQEDIVKEVGAKKTTVALIEFEEGLEKEVRAYKEKFSEAMFVDDRQERNNNIEKTKEELYKRLEDASIDATHAGLIIDDLINEIVHERALKKDERVDGRKMNEVRPLYSEVGLFKRLHGSAYFSRGATQSLSITTLAPPGQEQLVESMRGSMKRRFMLHYNFPPYSVGEVKRVGFTSRREIGHGALASKALSPILPSQEEFPYTIRLVSEILSSNGSSSMATVCAGTLSLMDAGVPIKKPVAGIAMGLITWQGVDPLSKETEYKILTDIQGPEDHYGDMDLKVAGTRDGITALQMDVKMSGIDAEMFVKGLEDAKVARIQLLDAMGKVIDKPRDNISEFAPAILTIVIKPEQIGEVIGPGGKVINRIIDEYKLDNIDIEEDGSVFVSADTTEKAQQAVEYIQQITKEYEVGDVVEGKVVRLMDFGGIVDLGGGKDGMVHISEVKDGFVKEIKDVLNEGDVVKAKVIKKDNGKLSLSIKALKAPKTKE